MTYFSISRSLGLMARTLPFLLLRIAVYLGIALAFVLLTGAGAGVGFGVGSLGGREGAATGAVWGGIAGFGLTAGLLLLAREYILYLVKAGHIAVLVELLDGRELPGGQGQIAYAQRMVTARFGEASILFGVDQLVKGTIRAVTGLFEGVLSILPIPGLDALARLARAYLRVSVGLLDEVILAYAMRTRATNPYASARAALVLYGQNAKPILVSAAWLTALVYLLSFVIFLVMLAPAGALVYLMPGSWSAGGFVFALVFAWAVKAAVIEPFAIACLLQAYFTVIEGQQPDPAWERHLDDISGKFRALGDKALAFVRPRTTGGPARETRP